MATIMLKRQIINDTVGNPIGVILPLEEYTLVERILNKRFPAVTVDARLAQMKQAVADPLFMADLEETMSAYAEIDADSRAAHLHG